MKVGILTFHASHNYGSMLQAYALQHTLTELGVENEIINFRSDIQKSLIEPPLDIRHPRSSLSKFVRKPSETILLMKKYKRFEKFLNKDLNVGKEINLSEQIPSYIAGGKFDAIITGSDQIWNPGCWDFDMCYFADFAFNGKRIAYAPSLGSNPDEIPANTIESIQTAINRYDSISTREMRGLNFLSKITNKPVDVVVDPTLLLNDEDYCNIAYDKLNIQKPYILYYTPREESGYFDKAKELSNLTGLDILVTQEYLEYRDSRIIRRLDCGPREFLTLIKNASYTIGNSFHLLAFSLIFKKEFYLLSSGADSRMMNILEPLGLQDRLIIDNAIHILSPIQYSNVEPILANAREKSLNYLYTALYS